MKNKRFEDKKEDPIAYRLNHQMHTIGQVSRNVELIVFNQKSGDYSQLAVLKNQAVFIFELLGHGSLSYQVFSRGSHASRYRSDSCRDCHN